MKMFIAKPEALDSLVFIYFCVETVSGTRIDEYGKFNKWLPRSHKGNLWL